MPKPKKVKPWRKKKVKDIKGPLGKVRGQVIEPDASDFKTPIRNKPFNPFKKAGKIKI
jgi:hypothetical protein